MSFEQRRMGYRDLPAYFALSIYMLTRRSSPLGMSDHWQKEFRKSNRRCFSAPLILLLTLVCFFIAGVTPQIIDALSDPSVPVEYRITDSDSTVLGYLVPIFAITIVLGGASLIALGMKVVCV